MPNADEVRQEIRAVLAERDIADRNYDALGGVEGGKLLNADACMKLSAYHATYEQRLAFARWTYGPCSEYILDRFYRKIWDHSVDDRWPRRLLFMAGGAASGKTRGVGPETFAGYEVVFDSNLAGFDKACKMIENALSHRWEVTIRYVHRDFQAAADAMVARGVKKGRIISLHPANPGNMAQLHFNAQQSCWNLAKKYDDVAILALNNVYPLSVGGESLLNLPVQALAPTGPLHYATADALYAAQATTLHRLRVDPSVSPAVLDALEAH